MKLKTVSGLSWVRAHPERFFRTGSPSGLELAYHLVCDALHLRAECTIARSGDWWVVFGPEDWLKHDTQAVPELFARVVAAPEQGVNSMRGEVIVAAFAAAVGTFDGASWTSIQGEIPLYVRRRLAATENVERAVAFCIGTATIDSPQRTASGSVTQDGGSSAKKSFRGESTSWS